MCGRRCIKRPTALSVITSSCMSRGPVLLVPALVLETSRQHQSVTANAVGLCTSAFPSQRLGGALPEALREAKSQREHRSEAPVPSTGQGHVSRLSWGSVQACGRRPGSGCHPRCSLHEYPACTFRDPGHLISGPILGQELK